MLHPTTGGGPELSSAMLPDVPVCDQVVDMVFLVDTSGSIRDQNEPGHDNPQLML